MYPEVFFWRRMIPLHTYIRRNIPPPDGAVLLAIQIHPRNLKTQIAGEVFC